MQTFTVYIVDYLKREKLPIGKVIERREKNRPNNLLGLLTIARKNFAIRPEEAFNVVLEKNVLMGPQNRI